MEGIDEYIYGAGCAVKQVRKHFGLNSWDYIAKLFNLKFDIRDIKRSLA